MTSDQPPKQGSVADALSCAHRPVVALVLNALIWGLSWWPFRELQAAGLHPLWATALIYAAVMVAIVALRPESVAQMVGSPALWVVALASGATNAAFNWAMVAGDVVRVILLFYLMPLWSVILARWILQEIVTRGAALRVSLGLIGAAVVLWPTAPGIQGWPLPRSLADWLGVLGGLAFALNNVMLRRERHCSEMSRALAMFVGGVGVAGALAVALPGVAWPPLPMISWMPLVLIMAVLFGLSNLALQFGAARLPASITAVVMLTEVVFASVSAWMWGGAHFTVQTFAGGTLILLAALLSARQPR